MNKSKFLKKSLAMVLAVMMIVAMIPLGASAATTNNSAVTDLAAIRLNGSLVNIESDGKTFKADISDATDNANKLQVDVTYVGETAVITPNDGSTPVDVTSQAGLELSKFDKDGNTYSIPLTLTSKDQSKSNNYTILLTLVSKNTTAEIKTVKAGDKVLSASLAGRTINVAVPLGYTSGASITVTTKDNATVNGHTTEELTGITDGQVVEVISESTGNTNNYKIAITKTPILETFSAGGVDAKIDNDLDNDGASAKISAVYPSSVLVVPDTEDKSPAQKFALKFTVAAGAEVRYAKDGTTYGDPLTSGKEYDFTDSGAFPASATIKVTCKGVDQEYALTFDTEKATENTVLSATIDGETATVAGKTITANLQSGATGNVTVTVVASAKATVKGTAAYTASGSPDADGNDVFTGTEDVADLKKGVSLVVTSQNSVDRQYSMKVTVTGEVDNTEITSFTLNNNGTKYEGTVNQTSRTINVTVPYLTTDTELAAMKVIATTNAYVKATNDGKTVEGTALTANDLGLATFALDKSTGSVSGKIRAVAKKTGSAPDTVYTVTVKLETAKEGKTLSSITTTSADKYKDVTTDNTYRGTIKTEKDKSQSIYLKVPYSVYDIDGTGSGTTGKPLYLKDIATANGGVVFMSPAGNGTDIAKGTMPAALDSKKIKVQGTAIPGIDDCSKTGSLALYVLPEKEARKVLSGTAATLTKGTAYAVKIEQMDPSDRKSLTAIKIGDTTLPATLTGVVPYGVTAADGTAATKATFIEFTASPFATVKDNTETITFVSGGATKADGTPEAAGLANGQLLLARDANNTVKVYSYNGSATVEMTAFVVIAEDGSKQTYNLGTLKYAAANTEAKINSFKLVNSNGTIVAKGNDNWAINVTVPFGTKVTALVPTFTASAGATVNDVTSGAPGTAVKSGETIMDFTNPCVLSVTSEDGGKTVTYTVKVTVADEFSDVPAGAWYHDYVMTAAAKGIVNGMGDGTFKPMNPIKRKDFAVMVVNMLGVDTSVYKTSAFKDVSDTDYAMDEIAYCKDHDIINGYEDGTFKPEKTITRQEAAVIMANALKLSATSPDKFKDDAKIASWAKTAVYQCRAAGVFSGDNGNFKPTTNITRAEAATVMVNASK